MRSASQSKTIDDTLDVPEELRVIGVSQITRKGNKGSGFVIIFQIKSRILSLYSKNKRYQMRDELEKTLKKFSKNDDQLTILRLPFESFIANNFDWINGKDATSTTEEYDESQESSDTQKNYFDKYRDLDKSDPLLDYKEVSVEEASQCNYGKIKFTGRITSMGLEVPRYTIESRWICHNCNYVNIIPFTKILSPPGQPKKCESCELDKGFDEDHVRINTRFIKIETDQILSQKAPLHVKAYVLDEDVAETTHSSLVTIYGEIENVTEFRSKHSISYVIAKRVLYHEKQTIKIQPEDLPKIIELSKRKDLLHAFAELYAPHILGFELEKALIILANIGAPTIRNIKTGEIKRGPLAIAFVGLPGDGKTELAVCSAPLKPRSKIVSCQYTTQATLCGSIVQEDGGTVVKPGIAALASGGNLILDELDKAKPDFVIGLLELADRCRVIIGKNNKQLIFISEVTILATLNPRSSSNWKSKRKLEQSDIPLPDTLISRMDLFIPVRGRSGLEKWRELADHLSDLTPENVSTDYDLLIKYIQKTQEIKSVQFSKKGKEIANKYAAKCADNNDLAFISSARSILTVHRFCKTFARVRLSDEVTEEIAEETIKFLDRVIGVINLNKASFLKLQLDPLELVLSSISNLNIPISRAIKLTNHIQALCQSNKDLDAIIPMKDKPEIRFKRNRNSYLNTLCDKITSDSRIGVTGSHKDEVYCIGELRVKSPDIESGRYGRYGREDPICHENIKKIIFLRMIQRLKRKLLRS